MSPRSLLRPACLALFAASASLCADPVTKRLEIDVGRHVPSRNLVGLAARADGRLVPGPLVTNLASPADLPQLLWTMVPGKKDHWLVGTGPEGKVLEVSLDGAKLKTSVVADFDATQVFALVALPGGKSFLAGTSPGGGLYFVRDGKTVARIGLPADSIFDLAALDDHTVLAATGNPGRIYRIDTEKFAKVGVLPAKTTDTVALEKAGVTLFGEIRDRNVRRLLVVSPTRVLAGSSPQGAVYEFAAAGAPPFVLFDPADSEVTDLLLAPDGAVYASFVYGTTGLTGRAAAAAPTPATAKPAPAAPNREGPGGNNENPPTEGAAPQNQPPPTPPAAPVLPPKNDFAGRSEVVRFNPQGVSETILARNGVAIYRLALSGDTLLMAAGENGEVLGFDLPQRTFLAFAGTDAAQSTALGRVDAQRWLVLKNNFAGFALLDFSAGGAVRTAETQKLDLGGPATLGSVRFARTRGIDPAQLTVEYRYSNSGEEAEGWSTWRGAVREDDSFRLPDARGRYVKLKFGVAAAAGANFELARPALFAAPQNHPPQIQEFRVLPPNLALVPAPEGRGVQTMSLNQLLYPGRRGRNRDADDEGGNPGTGGGAFLNSAVFPQANNQLVYWNAADSEGDNLVASLDLRRQDGNGWTPLAAGVTAPYASFSTEALADGAYVLRLTVTEQAPRTEADRLTTVTETDELVIDRTAPALLDAKAERTASVLRLTVHAKDALSPLRNAEVVLNNSAGADQTTPLDGVLDGRDETFVIELPLPLATGATSAEVSVYDAAGNRAAKRIALP